MLISNLSDVKKRQIWKNVEKIVDMICYIWYIGIAFEKKQKWSLKTEQNVNSIVRIKFKLKKIIFLESLILAQDERWRHA